MDYIVPHYIDGEVSYVQSAEVYPIFNPALGEVIGHIHCADADLCKKAVATAKLAWPLWAETPPIKRVRVLFKFRELLEKYQNDLARLVTKEHGKTLEDARGSVGRAIEAVEFYCAAAQQLQGTFSLNAATFIDCYTLTQPLGVCVGISPFNFPVMVPLWMMIPAIAYGNTFILKPSEQDPSAPIRICELLSEAGLPAGVVNCVQGDQKTVGYLLAHPEVSAVSAVASTAVARTIYREAINHGKRAATFGGAKNHCLVMPDANLDHTAKSIVGAAFGSAGERCMAISVVLVLGEPTGNALVEKLIPLIKAIRIGSGTDETVDMGPLISAAHRQRVIHAIDQGVEEGARLLIDGRQFIHPQTPEGFFLGPSLFDHVDEQMSVYQNEIFGPVLIILRVQHMAEAIALINRNPYGNGTALFTRDAAIAREYAQEVHVGMVGINIPIPVPIVSHPFGGWKDSVFGDTNMHGMESMHFYTKRKTVTSKWPLADSGANVFTMPVNK